jgi:hypothetical protein
VAIGRDDGHARIEVVYRIHTTRTCGCRGAMAAKEKYVDLYPALQLVWFFTKVSSVANGKASGHGICVSLEPAD